MDGLDRDDIIQISDPLEEINAHLLVGIREHCQENRQHVLACCIFADYGAHGQHVGCQGGPHVGHLVSLKLLQRGENVTNEARRSNVAAEVGQLSERDGSHFRLTVAEEGHVLGHQHVLSLLVADLLGERDHLVHDRVPDPPAAVLGKPVDLW